MRGIGSSVVACAAVLLAVATVISGLLIACAQQRLVLIDEPDRVRTPPNIREACSVAELKCSRCHDLERIRIAHHALVDWPSYVDKMRRQPGSGITQDDGAIILTCLDYLKDLQRQRDLGS
jgi:hypothetical protein